MENSVFSRVSVACVLAVALAGAVGLPVQAETIYVDAGCAGPGSGTVSAPYCAIQTGIDAASPGDTVQVAAGTYLENITMASGVVVQGQGREVTTIDGGAAGAVVTAVGVDSAAVLDGFTITNGLSMSGGGMYNENSSPTISNCTFSGNSAVIFMGIGDGAGMYNMNSSPTVTNCVFSENQASGKGGGMYNHGSSPTVTGCSFSDNTATEGGGMYNQASSPEVTGCTFSGNSSSDVASGGGMLNESSSPTVVACSFTGNSTRNFGGGMFNRSSSAPTVTATTFSGNQAGEGGGGMANWSSTPTVTSSVFFHNSGARGGGISNRASSPIVTTCTFSKNIATMGGGLYNELDSHPTVTSSILWGTDATEPIFNFDTSTCSATHSDIEWFGTYPGTGNIFADPMFVDAANGDLHLKPGSPCIDAGDTTDPALPAFDIDGDDRRIDDPTVADTGSGTPPIVDIGADEFDGSGAIFSDDFESGTCDAWSSAVGEVP